MPSDDERIADGLPVESADTAADRVPADGTVLVSGFGSVGYPKEVPLALARTDRDLSLTVVSGGSVGREIDVELVESDAIARRFPYQARSPIRTAVNDGRIAFHDRNISTLGDEVQYGGLGPGNVAIVEAVAVGEDWLVPSTSIGHTPAFVESASELIVEVNAAQPREIGRFHDVYRPGRPPNREAIPLDAPGDRIGGQAVRFDPEKLVAVVETDRRDQPYEFREPTADDRGVADNLRGFLEAEVERSPLFEESVRLQFGVGSLGNALMAALGDADFGDRDLVYFGEVIQDGLLDLLDDGRLRSASATSLALSEDGQDRLFDDVERYAEDAVLRPADVSNRPALVDRFGVVAVNSALEVDVYGHVNSTHVNGSRVVNGVGGSGDFNRHSPLAVTALPSTANGGNLTRVVPMVPHVDHTEHDVDAIVTEQGVADLRGKSPRERAREIVDHCAHPTYRERLREYLDDAVAGGGHVPHDLDSALSMHRER
ncbi:acetyl-CoA hydrolase (plasmid) [Halorussus salilacus]|uniref:acetyl-CoA hydrolase/transferase C-terminal domain-containing protein n=1 Tax=Halorussus salilacus TaxID=2953750 RepID=UPI0020A16A3E|nr:acetyl-CoA hydrolase/transferase C-terminal domain-containing protein [Halorussus salilacus]USZ70174.1 acetyl-CoA hydrolase [Halorussus salilacus]